MTNCIAWQYKEGKWYDTSRKSLLDLPNGWTIRDDLKEIYQKVYRVVSFELQSPQKHAQILPGPNITYKFPKFIRNASGIHDYHRKLLNGLRNISKNWYIFSANEKEPIIEVDVTKTNAEQEFPVPFLPCGKKIILIDPKLENGLLISPKNQHNTVCFFGEFSRFDDMEIPLLLKESQVIFKG